MGSSSSPRLAARSMPAAVARASGTPCLTSTHSPRRCAISATSVVLVVGKRLAVYGDAPFGECAKRRQGGGGVDLLVAAQEGQLDPYSPRRLVFAVLVRQGEHLVDGQALLVADDLRQMGGAHVYIPADHF